MSIYSPTLQIIISAAEKGNNRLNRDFREIENLQSNYLSAEKFAAASYKKNEEILLDNLLEARPDCNVLLPDGKEIINDKESQFRWVINPLCGLVNFAHAVPYFCLTIALQKKQENGNFETMAGLVSSPVENDIYYSEKGAGVYVTNRRVRVSSRDKMKNALVGMSPDFNSVGIESGLGVRKAIVKETQNVRNIGCSALDMAYVASGRYDACIVFNNQLCDTAAGNLLVRNAGGLVTGLDNKSEVEEGKELVASNGLVHRGLMEIAKQFESCSVSC